MTPFKSRYVAHKPDDHGLVVYSEQEHAVWRALYTRQQTILPQRACDEFLYGLAALGLQAGHIPQLPDINERLYHYTRWRVEPVAALIPARLFFELLATRKFPAATFIRDMAALDYVKEPDIFHELFGHCPLLVDPVYAQFLQDYAQCVLQYPETDWPLLQRLFWFTVEFGLIDTALGLRAYGGGILSSISETVYALESDVPMRVYFDSVAALRTPYRIDQLQPIYFVVRNYQQLYDQVLANLSEAMQRARSLGELPAMFAVDAHNPNVHINAC